MSRTVDVAGTSDRDPGTGLILRPFRGFRYAADVVDLAAVTSPPYDLIGAAEARRLEAQEPHNLVRLTLPDTQAPSTSRYARAASLLTSWLHTGVLRRDTAPALYVYEERGEGYLQRGLVGAIGLRAPEERVVLPHEDVHPVPVADRLAQMQATGANLEPIYLLASGTGAAAEAVAMTTDAPPLLTAQTMLGGHEVGHRLWAITDPGVLASVAAALRDRQALIADGHHRYAAYRALQAQRRDADQGAGPWDYGLAFLVDTEAHPPTLQAIHRVVTGLLPDDVVACLPTNAVVEDVGESLPTALLACADAGRSPDAHCFVVAGDGRFRLVRLPPVAHGDGDGHSAAWHRLDISVLHQTLFDHLLHLPDERLTFVHAADQAVRTAADTGGAAVLLNPPAVGDVFAVAAAGDRMPRKSTSFGPKPRNGLVMRELADPAPG